MGILLVYDVTDESSFNSKVSFFVFFLCYDLTVGHGFSLWQCSSASPCEVLPPSLCTFSLCIIHISSNPFFVVIYLFLSIKNNGLSFVFSPRSYLKIFFCKVSIGDYLNYHVFSVKCLESHLWNHEECEVSLNFMNARPTTIPKRKTEITKVPDKQKILRWCQ